MTYPRRAGGAIPGGKEDDDLYKIGSKTMTGRAADCYPVALVELKPRRVVWAWVDF